MDEPLDDSFTLSRVMVIAQASLRLSDCTASQYLICIKNFVTIHEIGPCFMRCTVIKYLHCSDATCLGTCRVY